MTRILVADPDPRAQQHLTAMLSECGYELGAASDVQDALGPVHDGEVDLILADLSLPGGGGMELLEQVRSAHPETAVVLLSAFGSVQDAVKAIQLGAADFLGKPFGKDQVMLAVDRALEKTALQRENQQLKHALDDRLRLDNVIGSDPHMQGIFKTVQAVADTKTTVLITGESGTGKTLLARAMHQLSDRKAGPFVEVNCGALPESLLESELFGHVKGSFTGAVRDKVGKFEAASGGTIFLDEIGTSTPAFQVKLLRVLQDRLIERVGDTKTESVDVRIVLATNKDLEQAVAAGLALAGPSCGSGAPAGGLPPDTSPAGAAVDDAAAGTPAAVLAGGLRRDVSELAAALDHLRRLGLLLPLDALAPSLGDGSLGL